MENMVNISHKARKYYSDKINSLPPNAGKNQDYHIRKMADRLADEFDEIWLKYEKGEVSFQQWKKSLNKWLKAELI
jgi:hypothetical protein|tara:strand:+ start:1394 stop:1621 length:228 start_codon:yes stop_codon:yes gene_type:complete